MSLPSSPAFALPHVALPHAGQQAGVAEHFWLPLALRLSALCIGALTLAVAPLIGCLLVGAAAGFLWVVYPVMLAVIGAIAFAGCAGGNPSEAGVDDRLSE